MKSKKIRIKSAVKRKTSNPVGLGLLLDDKSPGTRAIQVVSDSKQLKMRKAAHGKVTKRTRVSAAQPASAGYCFAASPLLARIASSLASQIWSKAFFSLFVVSRPLSRNLVPRLRRDQRQREIRREMFYQTVQRDLSLLPAQTPGSVLGSVVGSW